MSKKKTTYEEFIESLSPAELDQFEKAYKKFALSELTLSKTEQDEISMRKLAKIAGVP